MRAQQEHAGSLFSYTTIENRSAASHPRRAALPAPCAHGYPPCADLGVPGHPPEDDQRRQELPRRVLSSRSEVGDHPAQPHQVTLVVDGAKQVSSAWSRAWESTRDWFGVATQTSHGSLRTQWLETHSGASALGLVSVSQGAISRIADSRIRLNNPLLG